jgi:hypothetical protein
VLTAAATHNRAWAGDYLAESPARFFVPNGLVLRPHQPDDTWVPGERFSLDFEALADGVPDPCLCTLRHKQ